MKSNKLTQFTDEFKGEGQHALLQLGTLAASTAYFPNTFFRYKKGIESLSYFALYLAPPASGKGILKNAHHILHPLKEEIGPGNVYLSADSTDAMIYERLNHAKSSPLVMLDSEVNIVIANGKGEHGRKFRTNLMKIFSFEQLSVERKGVKKEDRIQYYIDDPRLSAVFTGTPAAFNALNLGNGDGFLSRIHLRVIQNKTAWESPKPTVRVNHYKELGIELGKHLLKAYHFLKDHDAFEILFQDSHWEQINQVGSDPKSFGFNIENDAVHESILRAGPRICKLAGICALINNADALSGQSITVDDQEFEFAFNLVIEDLRKISPRLVGTQTTWDSPKKSELIGYEVLKNLDKEFKSKDFHEAMGDSGLSISTSKRVLEHLKTHNVIRRNGHGQFKNRIEEVIEIDEL